MSDNSYILTTQCPDRPGIASALMTAIFEAGGNITEAQQYEDPLARKFFSRTRFSLDESDRSKLEGLLGGIEQKYDLEYKLKDNAYRPRVLILASKHDHCLGELVYRWRSNELHMDIVGLVSNHEEKTFKNVLTEPRPPFHYLPVTAETKPEQEQQILRIVEEQRVDLVVLARYMQILSKEMTEALSGRCINIHHSFLPGFKGAKPYHRAFERGVKIIGATAHYVTADLDEGPIIEQDVARVSHRHSPDKLVRKGADMERLVLSRAVKYHVEDRVILNGQRTIVFED